MGRYLTKLKFPKWARVAAKFMFGPHESRKKVTKKIYCAIKVHYELKIADEKLLAEAGFRLAKFLTIQG